MCDLFNEFMKFQKLSSEPMQICHAKKIFGQVAFFSVDNVKNVACQEKKDGAIEISIKHFPHELTRSGVLLSWAPIEMTTTVTTHMKLEELWTLKHDTLEGSYGTRNMITFHNCKSKSRGGCTMLTLTTGGEELE